MRTRWLNKTDLLIFDKDNPLPEERIIFRQVGWLGFSGKYYPLGEDVQEPAGFSPVYTRLGD